MSETKIMTFCVERVHDYEECSEVQDITPEKAIAWAEVQRKRLVPTELCAIEAEAGLIVRQAIENGAKAKLWMVSDVPADNFKYYCTPDSLSVALRYWCCRCLEGERRNKEKK